ncbi:MAG: 50S ribosomal protein L9 [Elusimicrobia bacterium]|jgi:large subunit ribosomal protein L9|nr:50S ribosomal protein L9 [Elusimicrobiota bacterium]
MKTKIILQEDIPNLGVAGDVKDVAPGYARNYLLPRKLAVPSSPRSRAVWDSRKKQLDEERKTKLQAAQERGRQLEEVVITISARAGQDGKLYGSVTTAEVAKALLGKGISIDRRWVELRDPIRTTGDFTGAVRLHPQVRAAFKIQVQPAG